MQCFKAVKWGFFVVLSGWLTGCGGGSGGSDAVASEGNNTSECEYTECSQVETGIGTVSYAVYQPSSLDENAPLLIILPGATATYRSVESTYQAREFADQYGYILLLAQSPQLAWPFNQAGTTAVIEVLDLIQGSYPVNQQVFMAGISNGSILSNLVACDYADRVTGIFSASGQMFHWEDDGAYGFCQPNDSVGIAYVHGTADNDIFYHGGGNYGGTRYSSPAVWDAFDFWRAHNQCSDEFVSVHLPELELGRTADTEIAQNCNIPMQFTTSNRGVHVPDWQPDILHNLMHTFFVASAAAKFG
ncbi:hypothetical protein EZV61_14620 [Corallincola luteus]|uniref:Alpha/beta hydrolase n=1 Tax=Corallincola luteus TaxID=1775177 RepID=A0ABY2ALP1_9GAMM|nr:hypothetical protein [Corallincola luteus]TCI02169.1 hypothetical protein EZV61_14620 [Corallincola luteus]